MGYEVVREVTQPVHGADGSVTHRPGDHFGLDEELPEGVPFRLVVATAADPVPATPAAPSKAASKGAAGKDDAGKGSA